MMNDHTSLLDKLKNILRKRSITAINHTSLLNKLMHSEDALDRSVLKRCVDIFIAWVALLFLYPSQVFENWIQATSGSLFGFAGNCFFESLHFFFLN
jgi:lipopolysaccharide/colanic/teichoic acid biosynthesis glycosyltransferase